MMLNTGNLRYAMQSQMPGMCTPRSVYVKAGFSIDPCIRVFALYGALGQCVRRLGNVDGQFVASISMANKTPRYTCKSRSAPAYRARPGWRWSNRSTPNWGERPTAAATWQQLCDVPAASIAASRLRKNERRLVSAVAASIIENTTDAQYYITLFYSYEFLLVCIAQLLRDNKHRHTHSAIYWA